MTIPKKQPESDFDRNEVHALIDAALGAGIATFDYQTKRITITPTGTRCAQEYHKYLNAIVAKHMPPVIQAVKELAEFNLECVRDKGKLRKKQSKTKGWPDLVRRQSDKIRELLQALVDEYGAGCESPYNCDDILAEAEATLKEAGDEKRS